MANITIDDLPDGVFSGASQVPFNEGGVDKKGLVGTAASANLTTSPTDTTAGRVTRVGDFGVGSSGLNTSEGDLDNLVTTGVYSTTGTALNRPPLAIAGNVAGVLTVKAFNTTFVEQSFSYTNIDTFRFLRWKITDLIWSPWVELYHTGNSVNAADFGLGVETLTASVSFDSIAASGRYYSDGGTIGAPNGFGWTLDHRATTTSGYASQTATAVQAGVQRVMSRNQFAGTWSAWTEQFHTENVATFNGVQQGATANGSIIESGSNANGEYVKFADGTMICRVSYTLGYFSGVVVNITTPATFRVGSSHLNTAVSVNVTPSNENLTIPNNTWLSDPTYISFYPFATSGNDVTFAVLGRWK